MVAEWAAADGAADLVAEVVEAEGDSVVLVVAVVAGDSVALVAEASVVAEPAAVGDNPMRIAIPREFSVADDRGISLSTLSGSEVF